MEGSSVEHDDAEEVNDDSPIEQVRLTVPISDDPSEPALTFRTWVLDLGSCIILSFVNQFFSYRTNQLSISSVSAQIASLPLGKLMAAILPTKEIRFPLTRWSFSLNRGPSALKEHVLITVFATSGSTGVYAMNLINTGKVFYRRSIHPLAAYLLVITTQMIGYGWAGVFRKLLVDSPYMWWPTNLVTVSLFRYVFYNASIIWGVIGPKNMFAKECIYSRMNWFFLIGLLAPVPVWLLSRKFPNQKWISLIKMPIIFKGPGNLLPARSVNFIMWGIVGLFFNFYVYKRYKAWWAKHTCVLSAALDAGVVFCAVLMFFTLQTYDIVGPSWVGLEANDHCYFAKCPTARGVRASGCPMS
ncbi:oligopeptide transporter 1-like [Neltuma alba]|uniref:oligopeptide transporter 1-like n=1 Tax=Neltuma alba TaxID=207710 RepID=UPI0010A4D594|nr:oligopeptide transporter 1-like [Prosopis alba]